MGPKRRKGKTRKGTVQWMLLPMWTVETQRTAIRQQQCATSVDSGDMWQSRCGPLDTLVGDVCDWSWVGCFPWRCRGPGRRWGLAVVTTLGFLVAAAEPSCGS